MRDGRWREVEVRHHEREDGAAVRHVPLRDASPRALGWIGLGPAPQAQSAARVLVVAYLPGPQYGTSWTP